ncbi:phosphonate ABC transporter ATP-binding protein [Leptolyngbya sp. 7M]|uniref:phosphonate ABC transporter ATP-binding protein n=1 Tax=Leptolyngbya sp. 7M TaxID=2812896 RepID=UPI001B8D99CB|nr:ATP-binding cassette domain-containing protein [Leptolyngbya sp. 7M]QYO66071.1 ATP-binding cassette domain-containing protein [Leptolyngbya sp. 7M]
METTRTATISPGEIAVGVEGLSLDRGDKRLFERMSWQLAAGCFLAVTGPSGSGKTSLLACLRGQIQPTDGSVNFADDLPTSIGTVFQHLRLTNELSVLTNVLCGCLGSQPWWKTLFAFGSPEKQNAFELIKEFGLADLCHKPVRSISGGEQQRTAIARVLMQDPSVILADEPTSNLDLKLAEQVLSRFRLLCAGRGKTVIAVLHDVELVERFADFELKIGSAFADGWSLRKIKR